MDDEQSEQTQLVRIWTKVTKGGKDFVAIGFGPNLGAANQHALEQLTTLMDQESCTRSVAAAAE